MTTQTTNKIGSLTSEFMPTFTDHGTVKQPVFRFVNKILSLKWLGTFSLNGFNTTSNFMSIRRGRTNKEVVQPETEKGK